MKFDGAQILPPKYWQEFEDLCLDLYRSLWGDPTAQKNGRGGQPQHGTDIWGVPETSEGYHGVQCKGKDARFGSALSLTELRDEVEKAKAFKPALLHWTLVTTAAKDGPVEELARVISSEHRQRGLFEVKVLGWDDLCSLIADRPALIEKYYPDQAPRVRRILEHLEGVPPADDPAELRRAAIKQIEKIKQVSALNDPIALDLERDDAERRVSIGRREIADALLRGQAVVLEADPGAGKSTTLIQLAEEILVASPTAVPIVLSLPIMAANSHGVVEEVAAQVCFRPLGATRICLAAEAAGIVLLCDGWNELSTKQRARVGQQLNQFKLDFPNGGLFVASRAPSPTPTSSASRVLLAPLTLAQQSAILTARLGPDKAGSLLARAGRIAGLREVLRVPLYVAALSATGGDGNLPETKEQVLSAFVRWHERDQQHKAALHAALNRRHERYLRYFAVQLTREQKTAVTDEVALRIIASVSARLKAEGQIEGLPEPADVLDLLVDHHLLVDRGEEPERLFSFQHEQFQEWYASSEAELLIRELGAKRTLQSRQALGEILNEPVWAEPVLFAVDRLSRQGPGDVRAVADCILLSLGIDPMFAAEMIQRTTNDVWALVSGETINFAHNWESGDPGGRALAFMATTGRPEFADRLWQLITDPNEYDRALLGRSILPSAFGPEWRPRLSGLSSTAREMLYWDIAASSGSQGIDFLTDAAKLETDPDAVLSILEHLEFRGARAEATELLRNATSSVWEKLASKWRLHDVDEAFRARLLQEKRALLPAYLAAGLSPAALDLMLQLYDAGEGDAVALVEAACDTNFRDNYHAQHRIFEELAARNPEALSSVVSKRVIEGSSVPLAALERANAAGLAQQIQLRQLAVDAAAVVHGRSNAAARLLDAGSTKALIAALIEVDARQTGDNRYNDELRLRYSALSDALRRVPLAALLGAVLDTNVSHPRAIGCLAAVISHWNGRGYDELLPLEKAERDRVVSRLQQWAIEAASHPSRRRCELYQVACAIKRIGGPDFAQSMDILLRAELALLEQQREEGRRRKELGLRRDPGSEQTTCYGPIYRQAFEALDGAATRDVLLSWLEDPSFGVEAARALKKYGASGPTGSGTELVGRPKFEQVQIARERRVEGDFPSESAVAHRVLNRAAFLVASEDAEEQKAAIEFASAAAQMDYGRRNETFI